MKYRLEQQKKKDARTKFYNSALKEAQQQQESIVEQERKKITQEDIKMAEQVIRNKIFNDTQIYERAVKKDNYREALLA